jgi:hypothetical protein
MSMKMKMEGSFYGQTTPGNNSSLQYWAHKIGGKILGPDVYYYGFEVWGENYVRWEVDDYNVDNGRTERSSEQPDPKGYWGY